jgi:hypothetical protein
MNETPLTIEKLLEILQRPGIRTVAGYNGSCELVIRLDSLLKHLQDELARSQEGQG